MFLLTTVPRDCTYPVRMHCSSVWSDLSRTLRCHTIDEGACLWRLLAAGSLIPADMAMLYETPLIDDTLDSPSVCMSSSSLVRSIFQYLTTSRWFINPRGMMHPRKSHPPHFGRRFDTFIESSDTINLSDGDLYRQHWLTQHNLVSTGTYTASLGTATV